MTHDFDLFGDPVDPNHGCKGRPRHVPTAQNRNLVMQLLAVGWTNKRIAGALHISLPTLREHYSAELKARSIARDRVNAGRLAILWEQVGEGNVAALKAHVALTEKLEGELVQTKFERKIAREPKAEKLGKKAQKARDAATAGHGTDWGSDLDWTEKPN